MGTVSRRFRFTIRGLMLLIAISALMLAGGIAIWERVELSPLPKTRGGIRKRPTRGRGVRLWRR